LCSCTGEDDLREDTSDGDTGGSKDSDRDGGGVEAPLDKDEELHLEKRERLMHLFSSIAIK
jgi:hypothetical protein